MVKSVINVEGLAREIVKNLQEYTTEVEKELKVAQRDVGKLAVEKLRQTSPKSPGGGDYARSWKLSSRKGRYIVHAAAPHYRLTHLLEKGHALVNGGRSRSFPHIKPAEDMVIKEYTKRVEEAIKK